MANKNEEKMDQLLNAMDVLIKAIGANWTKVVVPSEPTAEPKVRKVRGSANIIKKNVKGEKVVKDKARKAKIKAIEKLNKVIETKPLVVKQPAKKRGRPKAAPKTPPLEEEDSGEVYIHSIKPNAGKRKRGDKRPNIFDPSEFDTSADEKSAEYKKLKDGGIVRAEARQTQVDVFCSDCKKTVCVVKELARNPYYCGDFKSPDGCRNAR